jgi:hypothetical protein
MQRIALSVRGVRGRSNLPRALQRAPISAGNELPDVCLPPPPGRPALTLFPAPHFSFSAMSGLALKLALTRLESILNY